MKHPPATDATPEELVRALVRPSAGSPGAVPEDRRKSEDMTSGITPEAPEISASELREHFLTRMEELGLTPEIWQEFDRLERERGLPPCLQPIDLKP